MLQVSRLFTWIFALLILWGTTLPGAVVSGIYQKLADTIRELLHQILGGIDWSPIRDAGFSFDVPAHFLLFFLLSLCALHGYDTTRRPWIVPGIVLLAMMTELIQSWIPDRTTSTADFMLDIAGLGLACLLLQQSAT